VVGGPPKSLVVTAASVQDTVCVQKSVKLMYMGTKTYHLELGVALLLESRRIWGNIPHIGNLGKYVQQGID
jgi:hypothetical protein